MKQFTLNEQNIVTILSGDINPIHIDMIHARKYFDGKLIVYGCYIVLWMIEQLFINLKITTSHIVDFINVSYIKYININDKLNLNIQHNNDKYY